MLYLLVDFDWLVKYYNYREITYINILNYCYVKSDREENKENESIIYIVWRKLNEKRLSSFLCFIFIEALLKNKFFI